MRIIEDLSTTKWGRHGHAVVLQIQVVLVVSARGKHSCNLAEVYNNISTQVIKCLSHWWKWKWFDGGIGKHPIFVWATANDIQLGGSQNWVAITTIWPYQLWWDIDLTVGGKSRINGSGLMLGLKQRPSRLIPPGEIVAVWQQTTTYHPGETSRLFQLSSASHQTETSPPGLIGFEVA